MLGNPVTVNSHILEGELRLREETLLHYRIAYPQFQDDCHKRELCRINDFYRNRALKMQSYYEGELYTQALNQYEESIENEFPFHPYEAYITYGVTYNQDCVISVYSDEYTYTGGAHGNTFRQSETWNIEEASRIRLPALVRNMDDVIKMICKQIATQISHGEDWYFEDYPQLVNQNFNPNNFYLIPEGITVYFQQYDIAPYSSGIVEFILPWTPKTRPPKCCRS